MTGRFDGKVAIVTGAASGIGRATAARLASEGARVVLIDLSAEALEAAMPQGDHLALPCDVSDETSVAAAVETIRSRMGRIDVVCNNAGIICSHAPITEVDMTQWQRVIGVNLVGPSLASPPVCPICPKDSRVSRRSASVGSGARASRRL